MGVVGLEWKVFETHEAMTGCPEHTALMESG